MKKLLKKYREELLLGGLLLLILAGMIVPYLVTNTPFEYGGDLKPQYFAFYTEFRSLLIQSLKAGKLPFYSWNLFLGSNFWASKSYYILGDIFNYIFLVFKTHYYNIFMFQTILKLSVAGFSFYALAGGFQFNKKTRIILAISYAFSSWVLFFLGQTMFVTFYCFMPLFFLGIENYLRKNKKILFMIATAILLFTNYYLFFSLSILTPIYYTYRYYCLNSNWNGYLKKTLILIGYYFIGVMITGILTIPAALYIIQNDRVGTLYFSFTFDNIRVYLHELQSMFIPSHVMIYFPYNLFETGTHTTRELCLWAGSISALLVPQIFTDSDKRFKKATIILYIIYFLLLMMPIGSMIIHGFSDISLRWVFVIMVTNLLIAGRYLTDLSKINKKTLQITLIVIAIICLGSTPLGLTLTNQWDSLTAYLPLFLLSIICLTVFVILYFILVGKDTKRTLFFIIIVTTAELFGYSSYLIGYQRRQPLGSWEFIYNATHVLQTYPDELNQYLDGFDENNYREYYRVYVPHDSIYWSYSHNQGLHYQLQGVMTYDSTYAPALSDLKRLAPQVKDFASEWIFNIKDPDLINFLNVKYAVVIDASELPHNNFTLLTDTYRGSLSIYLNNEYRPLGTTYSKVISYEEYEASQMELETLENTVIAFEKDVSAIQQTLNSTSYAELVNIQCGENYLMGEVTTDASTFMVITLPYDQGWTVRVNGETVPVYRVSGGMMGIPLGEGYQFVEMYFTPQGFKAGFYVSAIGVVLFIVIFYFDKRGSKKK